MSIKWWFLKTLNTIILNHAIRKVAKLNISFLDLNDNEKQKVLEIINGKIQVFGHKWYDILSNNFLVEEYLLDDTSKYIIKKIRRFESFEDLFNYVSGDIYQNTCFYGYKFTNEEISKFSIDVNAINFESFINETIDDYTFEKIIENERKDNAEKAIKLIKWFNNLKPISTLENLEIKFSEFKDLFDCRIEKNVFFSMLLRKDFETIQTVMLDYFFKYGEKGGLTFGKILMTFDHEADYEIIEQGEKQKLFPRKEIKKFKLALDIFENGTLTLKKTLGYDKNLKLYYIKRDFYDSDSLVFDDNDYFVDFTEFVNFTKGNLCDANLSYAPLSNDEILKYQTNYETKLPFQNKDVKYELLKEFKYNKFDVTQKWYDEDGKVVFCKNHSFDYFFDFVHFLKGDLSNANLVLCEGIKNLNKVTGLKLDGIKACIEVNEKLLNIICEDESIHHDFETTNKNEIATKNNFEIENILDADTTISYITDIHLLHRFEAFKCKTTDDVNFVIKSICNTLKKQSTNVNLIGGDTSSNFEIFKVFVSNLSIISNEIFFTLGNHELWDFKGENLNSIIEKYRNVIEQNGNHHMHLVQNNIFYATSKPYIRHEQLNILSFFNWKEITEEELTNITIEELKNKTREAKIIIFGGLGFAGKNESFNANNGIYLNTLDRDSEIKESNNFLALYEKVVLALKGKNLIVFTHMPMQDWGGINIQPQEGVLYINGHNHHNYCYDDGHKRIYANNQVGYHGKQVSFKKVDFDFNNDYFADYTDGIYEITREEYIRFYSGIFEYPEFNRQFDKLYMLKHDGAYMFIMKSLAGHYQILNGGQAITSNHNSINYFYDNLPKYAQSIKLFLSKYDKYQQQISKEIKRIGGDGKIHGCIVDIDYFSHLYVNPLDNKIVPYFAYSIVDKYIYTNIASLLKNKCSTLYENLISQSDNNKSLVIYTKDSTISNDSIYFENTDMYKISRIVKGLQFTSKYNIVRFWNDALINDASENNGKLIVTKIIENKTGKDNS